MNRYSKIILINLLLLITMPFIYSEEKVLIHFYEYGQAEIIKDKVRILIDVQAPSNLTADTVFDDEVLLTTSNQNHHLYINFVNSYKCKKIFVKQDQLKTKDYFIKSIPSVLYADEKTINNYIYIIEIAGLRIAHLGDMGNETLTPDELKEIGEIDILFAQLSNRYSSYTLKNEKGYRIVNQINPRIVVPTHVGEESGETMAVIEKALKMWNGKYNMEKFIEFSKSKLPAKTMILFLGSASKAYGIIFKLEELK